MKDKLIENADNQVMEIPFVNDECGDTMWDEVLSQVNAEEAARLVQFTF